MKKSYILILMTLLVWSCKNKDKADGDTVNSESAMFEMLMSSETGIDFVNECIETDEVNVATYQYIYNGSGVAVGDINNDGLQDLFFSSNQGDCKLYLNKGDFKFEDITVSAGIKTSKFCTGTLMGDLNNDGFLDIYVCRSNPYFSDEDRTNFLFVNNGNLTFTDKSEDAGINDMGHSSMASVFDMDNDGDLDLFVGNHPIDHTVDIRKISAYEINDARSTDRMYENQGDGTFKDITASAGVGSHAFALSIATTDFNKDGFTDIYVCNDYYGPDFCYINQGDGTFKESQQAMFKHTSTNAMGSDAADFNNDGLVDLTVMDMLPEDNYHRKLLMGPRNFDFYLIRWLQGYGHQNMKNSLQLNSGEGNFNEISCYSGIIATDWSWAPLFADLDNDGWKDLYVTNGYYRDVTNQDFVNFEANFIQKNNRKMGITELSEQLPNKRTPNYAYKNNGDLTFKDVSRSWGLAQETVSNGAAYADLNNDGRLDLIACNMNQEVHIYKNNGAEPNAIEIQFNGSESNKFGIGAQVTLYQGGNLQYAENYPVRGYNSSVAPVVHFGLGEMTAIDSIIVVWPSGIVNRFVNPAATSLTVHEADGGRVNRINVDENPLFTDVSETHLGTIKHAESGYIDFKREPLIPKMFSKRGPGLSVGDVNGDQREDFIMAGSVIAPAQLYLQDASGSFKHKAQPWASLSGVEIVASLLFDVDGDNDLDVYLASGSNEFQQANDPKYQDQLYLNDGKGNFSASNGLPEMLINTACVKSHDIDGDGDLDLFVGGNVIPGQYPLGYRSYILKNEAGVFTDVTTAWNKDFTQNMLVNDAEFADITGDGKAELIVASEWSPIKVYKNEGQTFKDITTQVGLANFTGWWNGIELADIDGDGDLDLMAGNVGLNAQYEASSSKPLYVDYGDLDGNGSFDAVVSQYYGGVLAPIYSKNELEAQMRYHMNTHYKFHEDYARANTTQFLNTTNGSATRLSINTLQSMVFENKEGVYTPLNTSADLQFSPLFDFQVVETNAGTKVLAIGNAFDNKIELGWTDGTNGLVLSKTAKGIYTHEAHTGFMVPENAKQIVPIVIKGVTYYLVSTNNDKLKLFKLN